MATLEEKILDGPRENYCDNSEGEDDREDDPEELAERSFRQSKGGSTDLAPGPEGMPPLPPPPPSKWGGTSQNTGPKGVLRDWELYKEHEAFLRMEKERELVEMVKARSLTCKTNSEDEKVKEAMAKLAREIEEVDLDERLMSDKVLEEFVKKRMDLMMKSQVAMQPTFGQGLVNIQNGDEFLKIIDQTNPGVSIVIHIYDDKLAECAKMNECLENLSSPYPNVQFCKIRADAAGVSQTFRAKGIPALLVYKGGNLIGNFIQLTEDLGTDFYPGDVENFLIENGMLEDQNNIPALLAKQRIKFGQGGAQA